MAVHVKTEPLSAQRPCALQQRDAVTLPHMRTEAQVEPPESGVNRANWGRGVTAEERASRARATAGELSEFRPFATVAQRPPLRV